MNGGISNIMVNLHGGFDESWRVVLLNSLHERLLGCSTISATSL
jgi:hypothetical protein